MQDIGSKPMASHAVEMFMFAHMLSISPMIQRYQDWLK